MSAGLYSREVMAVFLGKKVEELERMIAEDGLLALPVPGERRQRHKFSATQLCGWLNKRNRNSRWTVEEVIAELDRCVPDRDRDQMEGRLGKVTELRDLCDAAERAMRRGAPCPRVVQAIADVAAKLKTEVCAA